MAIFQRRAVDPALSRRVSTKSTQTRSGRVVVASALPVTINDRTESARLQRVRQAWQPEAWVYSRSLGELGYARRYMGNSCMRLRWFIGTNVPGAMEPVDIIDVDDHGLPPDLVAAAQAALVELGNGNPTGTTILQKRLTENFQVTGECWLIGRRNSLAETPEWRIYSTSEVHIDRDGRVGVRDLPGNSGSGQKDVQWLDPKLDYMTRLWTPDPEWALLADSPVRNILDICEELLLAGRDIRSTLRSRIASNGVLLVPDGLSVVSGEDDGGDEDDDFMSDLVAAGIANMQNEGEASAAFPVAVRGPADALKEFRHMPFDRPATAQNVTTREELIGRMATSIDLPAEVLTGKVDLNHWTSWQVDDDTFRHHIEPTAIQQVDSATTGYLWRRLDAYGRWDPALIRRLIIWYDPTALVTHPDRTQDAMQVYDRFGISDEALRSYSGFGDDDAPDDEEKLLRIALRIRSLDPAVQVAILKRLDPTLDIQLPAVTGGDGGGQHVETPAEAPPQTQPGPPPNPAPGAGEAAQSRMHERLRAVVTASAAAPTAVTHTRESRQLLDIDRRLRDRVVVAANTAIRRSLERAGARAVSKARTASAASVRAAIQDVHPALVCGTLGRRMVASLGLTEEAILDTEFEDLRRQWEQWVKDAQEHAFAVAGRLAQKDLSVILPQYERTLQENRDEGWTWLRAALERTAHGLFNDVSDVEEQDVLTSDFVNVGDVRAAIGLAGGYGDDGAGLTSDGFPVDPGDMMGQIGTGDTVSDFLTTSGLNVEGYEWVHGGSGNAFIPHLELDGNRYANFDDPSHSTGAGTFPPGGYYYPGDHNGCSCDFMPIIISAA